MGSVEDLIATNAKETSPNTLWDGASPNEGDWYTIDPNDYADCLVSSASSMPPSPMEEKIIQGRRVFIKRDDLLRLPGSSISGNKARKMFFLNQLPASQFPQCIVSYGGPQSNAMLALAAVVNYKNRESTANHKQSPLTSTTPPSPIRFVYYTKKLPRFLRKQASGNLFRALTLGMEILELSPKDYQDLFGSDWGGSASPPPNLTPPVPNSLWIPQGGANELAMAGANQLALELHSWWQQQQGDALPVSVVFPGGTCTTALLVHHALQKLKPRIDMEVVVIPCVGDAAYAQRQMMALSAQIGVAPENIPHILPPWPETSTSVPSSSKKGDYFTFGEPDVDILSTFTHLKEDYELVLDLVYGAPAWTILLRHWHQSLSPDLSFDARNAIAGREIIYVHSGGLEGINSQLLRYNYKGLVDLKDIQLP